MTLSYKKKASQLGLCKILLCAINSQKTFNINNSHFPVIAISVMLMIYFVCNTLLLSDMYVSPVVEGVK